MTGGPPPLTEPELVTNTRSRPSTASCVKSGPVCSDKAALVATTAPVDRSSFCSRKFVPLPSTAWRTLPSEHVACRVAVSDVVGTVHSGTKAAPLSRTVASSGMAGRDAYSVITMCAAPSRPMNGGQLLQPLPSGPLPYRRDREARSSFTSSHANRPDAIEYVFSIAYTAPALNTTPWPPTPPVAAFGRGVSHSVTPSLPRKRSTFSTASTKRSPLGSNTRSIVLRTCAPTIVGDTKVSADVHAIEPSSTDSATMLSPRVTYTRPWSTPRQRPRPPPDGPIGTGTAHSGTPVFRSKHSAVDGKLDRL